jgi:dihydrofolate reductase
LLGGDSGLGGVNDELLGLCIDPSVFQSSVISPMTGWSYLLVPRRVKATAETGRPHARGGLAERSGRPARRMSSAGPGRQNHERPKGDEMRKVIVNEFLTLDGTAEAAGSPDEDTAGGFQHGGWHTPYHAEDGMEKLIGEAGGFVLGRHTYEAFAGYWPNAPEALREFAEAMNTKPKHVASRTLTGPLKWQNSTVLPGALPEAVAALKEEDGAYLLVIGSSVLVQSLIQHGLVDEFRLMIDPVLVGGGKRFFPDDGTLRALRLVDHEVTSTGTIIATYAPA